MESKEFILRLIAIIVLSILATGELSYCGPDKSILLYVAGLIGLLAGIEIPKRLMKDNGGSK